ncbi:hypothetical protein GTP46_08410 [Duganella sp. FT135W]|uniref:Uncharacterized protein n=1 Tax=Duganella flavida TaxID=2692175 RepID=A0A6L8K7Y4_9BURK|nr:hypothetical protein [Duganella flavida]MYM22667.1 hypothetical protein [Duganella flavida]
MGEPAKTTFVVVEEMKFESGSFSGATTPEYWEQCVSLIARIAINTPVSERSAVDWAMFSPGALAARIEARLEQMATKADLAEKASTVAKMTKACDFAQAF